MKIFLRKQAKFLPYQGRRGGVSDKLENKELQNTPSNSPCQGENAHNFAGFFQQVRIWVILKQIKSGLKMKKGFFAKNPGIVILVPTIILSGLILIVSVGLSQVLMRELEFSADLLFSEKAYFAAESGVEKSLLALKDKPLNWVETNDFPVGAAATYDLNIANSVSEFPFNLARNETIKFQLGVDNLDDFAGYQILPVTNFKIGKLNETGEFVADDLAEGDKENLQWKILCQKTEENSAKTVALFDKGINFNKGIYDDGETTLTFDEFGEFIEDRTILNEFRRKINNNICFMSLTNLFVPDPNNLAVSGKIRGIFKADKIAPAKVRITATGKSFSREKIVSFEYRQKNLSSIFDLGLYFMGE